LNERDLLNRLDMLRRVSIDRGHRTLDLRNVNIHFILHIGAFKVLERPTLDAYQFTYYLVDTG
jgi:hypothetical protein